MSIYFRILGHRVAELEKKLKTLEVSGLWSLQGLWFHITVNHLFQLFVVFSVWKEIDPQNQRHK